METKSIKAAAVFAKKEGGFELRIWANPSPYGQEYPDYLLSEDYLKWFKSECVILPWYDDTQPGKFVKMASNLYHGDGFITTPYSFWDGLTKFGIFFDKQHLKNIKILDNKILWDGPWQETAEQKPIRIPEKTIQITGKKLWRYCWVSALIGLVIGVSWGLVLGTVLTVKHLEPKEKTPTFNSPLKTH